MYYSSDDNKDSFYFGLSCDLGCFVADNIAIGGNLPISYFSSENYKFLNIRIHHFSDSTLPIQGNLYCLFLQNLVWVWH